MSAPHHLVIGVRFHDGRYHGMGEWLPSPARLFQALVSAGDRGGIDDGMCQALEWLQAQRPPTFATPAMRAGQRISVFGPDNDIDTVEGDLDRVGEIRSPKVIEPRLFDASIPFVYAWPLEEHGSDGPHVQKLCTLADRLYQFGRGVDMAWAWGEVLDANKLESRLSSYPGMVYRPSEGGTGRTLACPQPGSLKSLMERHAANRERFRTEGHGKAARQVFLKPPKPRFAHVAYESPPSRRVYELRKTSRDASFAAWPLAQASKLIVCVRDGAVDRLCEALPERSSEVVRVLVGRKADGTDDGPTSLRVKIVPLPSIGHPRADRAIRRVLVEIPAGCPVSAEDVHWAFSGLELVDEVLKPILTRSQDETMLAHYGVTDRVRARLWRTVTPAALPESTRRRRIEPTRLVAEAKGGADRAAEETRAATSVTQALRQAEVRSSAAVVRVQREPFDAKGERVEAFSPGTRFVKERLWHVEVTFDTPVQGPVIIGDGRFLGLGVMYPVPLGEGVHAFVVEAGLSAMPKPTEIASALRRAVMARVNEALGRPSRLPAFFSGHESDGSQAQSQRHPHLTFVFDPESARLLVVAPHVVDRRATSQSERNHLEVLNDALAEFRELRAGSSGRLTLRATALEANSDPLFAPSRTWQSATPYQVTRHAKEVGAHEALAADIRAECRSRGLPEPRVTSRQLRGVPGVGLVGGALLTFAVAVEGPIMLGRSRHLGGGLFAAVRE